MEKRGATPDFTKGTAYLQNLLLFILLSQLSCEEDFNSPSYVFTMGEGAQIHEHNNGINHQDPENMVVVVGAPGHFFSSSKFQYLIGTWSRAISRA